MTTAHSKARCVTCNKEKATLKCEGCMQTFCYNHVTDHRQELNKQLEDIKVTCDLIQDTLSKQTTDLQKHPLIQKINEWEHDSIEKIRQTAEEARQLLIKHTIGPVAEIEVKLNKVINQIRQNCQENDFFEPDLRQLKENLAKLKEELPLTPSNVIVREDSTPLVNKIYVDVADMFITPIKMNRSDLIYTKKIHFPIPQLSIPLINNNTRWIQNGITIAGGNGSGNELSQLYNPLSVCIDDNDQTIYIADYWNNRIIEWKSGAINGQIIVSGTIQKNQIDQLNCPRDVILDKKTDSLIICDIGNRQVVQWPRHNGTKGKTIISDIDCWGLAMDSHGYLYVSDNNKHEVKRWRIGDTNGTVVAGGNGPGNRLDQLNYPTYIFVDREQSVYVSDRYNHRVMKWKLGAKEGIIVAGNQTEGNSLKQLSYPTGIVVDQLGAVYVADSNNHRVMRWSKEAVQGSIIVGGNGHGEQSNQLYNPWGLSFDRQCNLYVADNANHRIQKFNVDSNLTV
jgi:sugar lactone lactonase YvrE